MSQKKVIKITESELRRIISERIKIESLPKQTNTPVKKHIQEVESNDERYSREVKVTVYSSNVKINGEDIDGVSCPNLRLSYLIEQEHRSWGIKDISLYSIEGPSEVEFEITPQVDDLDADDITVTIPVSWDTVVKLNYETGEGVVTLGNEIEVNLKNDENGNVVIDYIDVTVYTL